MVDVGKSSQDDDGNELKSCIKLPLEEKQFDEILLKAKDWAVMHGAGMRLRDRFDYDSIYFAPFTLIPSTFPRSQFEAAVNVQVPFNELVHKVAHNHQFLAETLKKTIAADPFTGRLFEIYEKVRKEGITQPVSLCIVRSDVMLAPVVSPEKGDRSGSSATETLKQVEWNNIASGFGHLGPISARIHRYILRELGHSDLIPQLPENLALEGLCGGMIAAWDKYGVKSAILLIVVEDTSYNICDQRFHEFYIRDQRPEIKIVRRSLTQINDEGSLKGDDKRFFIGDMEVALVYFRSGYEPKQYHGEAEWDARLLMERSLAIKCPSINYHLAGTKKVQQALAVPGALEQFFPGQEAIVEQIRSLFTAIYSLDVGEQGDKAVQLALSDPEKYVLKPQREGGGNNFYGTDIADKIREIKDTEERNAWILMERIRPPSQKTFILRPGTVHPYTHSDRIVSELGIFGVILGDEKEIFLNKQSGHMLRSKLSDSNEGGVAAGLGCLDSPILIP